jgi:hypothetical protein
MLVFSHYCIPFSERMAQVASTAHDAQICFWGDPANICDKIGPIVGFRKSGDQRDRKWAFFANMLRMGIVNLETTLPMKRIC